METVQKTIEGMNACHCTLSFGKNEQGAQSTIMLYVSDQPNPPFGSFVYAVPTPRPDKVYSTKLIEYDYSIETATRLATLLAKKFQHPVYVASSVSAEANLYGIISFVGQALANSTNRE